MGKKSRRNRVKETTKEESKGTMPVPPVPDLQAQRRALREALAECPFEELRSIYEEHVLVWKMSPRGVNFAPVSEEELTANPKLARAKMEEHLNGEMHLGPVGLPARRAMIQKLNSVGGIHITFKVGHGSASWASTVGFALVGGKELVMQNIHRSMFHLADYVFNNLFQRHKEGRPVEAGELIVAGDVLYIVRAPDPMQATIIKAMKAIDAKRLHGVGGYDILLLEAVAVKQKRKDAVEGIPEFTRAGALKLGMGCEGPESEGYKFIGPNAQLEACDNCVGVWDAAEKSNRLKMCLGCKKKYYCSKECQALAWPEHKSICQLSKKERLGVAAAEVAGMSLCPLKESTGMDESQFVEKYNALKKMTRKKKQSKS